MPSGKKARHRTKTNVGFQLHMKYLEKTKVTEKEQNSRLARGGRERWM